MVQGQQFEPKTKKTNEIIVDFRKTKMQHTGLSIDGEEMERVAHFKFLGVALSEDLSWRVDTTHIMKKTQQRFFL